MDPISVYINWSCYDEISDNVELTEELAMAQLDELVRLRGQGVRFDYYIMDAFWYDFNNGYRTWRKPHWPNGPDGWLRKCAENRVFPALWVSCNTLSLGKMKPVTQWLDSMNRRGSAMCMFEGGFLADFMDVLRFWYSKGVRLFKFDFADLDAATPHAEKTLSPEEIRIQNTIALRNALAQFKEACPDVRLIAYNGFGGDIGGTYAPVRKTVDVHWIDVFDSLYCGDPRPADVPCMNFWRSKDIYSDHMVRYYEANGIPLERIDNTSFMIGTTGTCYFRKNAAWKGMLVLSLARSGAVNTYYGNLELLDNQQASWFAKVQSMYLKLQSLGKTATFGPMPGEQTGAYGFASYDQTGSVYTIVNPCQKTCSVTLPRFSLYQIPTEDGAILFTDSGYAPTISGDTVTLGSEQLAVIGFGSYASGDFSLGIEPDVRIPLSIENLNASFESNGTKSIVTTLTPSDSGDLRIVVRQFDGPNSVRSSGGAPPHGIPLGQILTFNVSQNGKPVPVHINYDKMIWSGLSWAVGEISRCWISENSPLRIECSSTEKGNCVLSGEIFGVMYEVVS